MWRAHALLLSVALLLGGCRKHIDLAPPANAQAITTWYKALEGLTSLPGGQAPASAKEKRNLAIAYSEALVMSRYGAIRSGINSGRSWGSVAFDVLDLGLTSTVPIVNGARGKSILGALATGFKGSRLSVDKNVFNEQTTGAILSAMDACVLRQRGVLAKARSRPADQYLVYDAYSDLVQLYGCTTLAGAVRELVETQAVSTRLERDIAAKGNVTIAPVSVAELTSFSDVSKAFAGSVGEDKKKAVAFLEGMGVTTVTVASSAADLIQAYRELHLDTLAGPDREKFLAAAKKSGLSGQ